MKEWHEAYDYSLFTTEQKYLPYALLGLARAYSCIEDWDKVEYYYEQSIEKSKEKGNLMLLSVGLGEITEVYIEKSKYELAVQCLHAKMQLVKQDQEELDFSYYLLGDVYLHSEQYDSAHYYLEMATTIENIYNRSGIYESLYKLRKQEGKYKEAIEYNDIYRNLMDSIYKITRSKEIAEITEKYNHEKLVNINNQLKIEKGNWIRSLLFILIIFMVISFIFIYHAQHKLLEKERFLQKTRQELHYYTSRLYENELEIKKNEEMINSITGELKGEEDLKEVISEQKNELHLFRSNNEHLLKQNHYLSGKIEEYTSLLQQKNSEAINYKKLIKENIFLQDRAEILSTYALRQHTLYNRLKVNPKYIREEEWAELEETVNTLYNGFTNRLKKDYSALTDNDIQICSLIKLKFTTSYISTFTGISPASATKRKQRIKERMKQQKEDLWNEQTSLEFFLWNY